MLMSPRIICELPATTSYSPTSAALHGVVHAQRAEVPVRRDGPC